MKCLSMMFAVIFLGLSLACDRKSDTVHEEQREENPPRAFNPKDGPQSNP